MGGVGPVRSISACPRSSTWAATTSPIRWRCSGRRAPASRSSRSTTGSVPTSSPTRSTPTPGAFVVYEGEPPAFAVPGRSRRATGLHRLARTGPAPRPRLRPDPDLPCVLLYTSGTTAAPKAAVLRHRHLMSYLLGTVEFASADEEDATLVSVPPYHVAGVANLLSNLYAGRRIIYLDRFDPEAWLRDRAGREGDPGDGGADHAGPDRRPPAARPTTPTPRACGPSPTAGRACPTPVLHRALDLFPTTGFVNAYGLTETSSTIALLGPEDHRAAFEADDPVARAAPRLGGSARPRHRARGPGRGRTAPRVRADPACSSSGGSRSPASTPGWPRPGTTAGSPPVTAAGSTRTGTCSSRAGPTTPSSGVARTSPRRRSRTCSLSHDGIVDAVVVGLPDDQWGQRLVAVVVPAAKGCDHRRR